MGFMERYTKEGYELKGETQAPKVQQLQRGRSATTALSKGINAVESRSSKKDKDAITTHQHMRVLCHNIGNPSRPKVTQSKADGVPIETPLEEYNAAGNSIYKHIVPVQATETDYVDDYARYTLWIVFIGVILGCSWIVGLLVMLQRGVLIGQNESGESGAKTGFASVIALTLGVMVGPFFLWVSGDMIIRVKQRLTPFYEGDLKNILCFCLLGSSIDVWDRAWDLRGIVDQYENQDPNDRCTCLCSCWPDRCCGTRVTERDETSQTDVNGEITGDVNGEITGGIPLKCIDCCGGPKQSYCPIYCCNVKQKRLLQDQMNKEVGCCGRTEGKEKTQ